MANIPFDPKLVTDLNQEPRKIKCPVCGEMDAPQLNPATMRWELHDHTYRPGIDIEQEPQ